MLWIFFYNYERNILIIILFKKWVCLHFVCFFFSYQLLQCLLQNFCSCRPPQRSLFQAPRSKSPTWTQPNIFTYVSRMEPPHECSGRPLYDQNQCLPPQWFYWFNIHTSSVLASHLCYWKTTARGGHSYPYQFLCWHNLLVCVVLDVVNV